MILHFDSSHYLFFYESVFIIKYIFETLSFPEVLFPLKRVSRARRQSTFFINTQSVRQWNHAGPLSTIFGLIWLKATSRCCMTQQLKILAPRILPERWLHAMILLRRCLIWKLESVNIFLKFHNLKLRYWRFCTLALCCWKSHKWDDFMYFK